jgi:hypothetical protein
MKMKKYVLLFAVAVTAIAATSCNKEQIRPEEPKQAEPTLKRPPQGGIQSIHTWTGSGTCWLYNFGVTSWGQKPDDFEGFGPASGTSTMYTFGAAGSIQASVYINGSSLELAYGSSGSHSIVTVSFPGGVSAVEEVEIDPLTNEVYALVRMNRLGQMGLYHIDYGTGSATFVATLHAAGAGSTGSITFVPGTSGNKLLYVYEPTASTATMNYYTLPTTTTLSFSSSVSVTGNFVPGTGGLNICYGNARLFFARDSGDLYQAWGTSLPTSGSTTPFGTVAETNANFDNQFDFGYYGT